MARPHRRRARAARCRTHRDHPAGLSVAAIIPIVYAVKRTFGSLGVDLAAVGPLLLGVLAGMLFLRRQRTLAEPMIDVSLFARPAFRGALTANSMSIFALTGLLFFFSQYLQLVREYGPLTAGLAELPVAIGFIVAIVAIGVVSRRLGVGTSIGAALIVAAAGFAAGGHREPGWLRRHGDRSPAHRLGAVRYTALFL